MKTTSTPNVTPHASRSALWPSPLSELNENVRAILENRIERGLAAFAKPFRGITTDGTVREGLFPIRPTGVSVQPVIDAARAFVDLLDPNERKAAMFDVGSNEWRTWSNAHPFLFRHGVCLHWLSAAKRQAALALIRATVSAEAYKAARDVMKLSEHLRELTGRPEEHGEWHYFVSLFGEPSTTEPWGWQVDGHHLIINCFVLGDQMVVTPHFVGAEPVKAEFGIYAGTRCLQEEEEAGLSVMSVLTPPQRDAATLGDTLPRELFTTAPWDNHVMAFAGIRHDALDSGQQARLLDLIGLYVGRIRPEHAAVKLAEAKRHLDETWFGWIGPCDDESPFYYRVHSPVLLIEFVHQRGVAFDNEEPTRNHAHALIRTPNGNDYGRALLRQYQEGARPAEPALQSAP